MDAGGHKHTHGVGVAGVGWWWWWWRVKDTIYRDNCSGNNMPPCQHLHIVITQDLLCCCSSRRGNLLHTESRCISCAVPNEWGCAVLTGTREGVPVLVCKHVTNGQPYTKQESTQKTHTDTLKRKQQGFLLTDSFTLGHGEVFTPKVF